MYNESKDGGLDVFRPKKVVGLFWANGTQIDLGQPSIEESAPTFMPALSDKGATLAV